MRTGKIARLPAAVRDELGRKLDNGMPSGQILPWLNGLPEVQAVLGELFGGRPLNKQNLSHWRAGGHQEWRRQQEVRRPADRIAREIGQPGNAEMCQATADGIGPLLGLVLMQTTEQIVAETNDAGEQLKYFREAVQGMVALRRTGHQIERQKLKEAWAEFRRQQRRSRQTEEGASSQVKTG